MNAKSEIILHNLLHANLARLLGVVLALLLFGLLIGCGYPTNPPVTSPTDAQNTVRLYWLICLSG
jgi:hypothetical protein